MLVDGHVGEVVFLVGVTGHEVDGVEAAESEDGKLVGLGQVARDLALEVAVLGYRPGADGIDDELEVAAPRRHDPGAAPIGDGALEDEAGAPHVEIGLAVQLVAVPLAQVDVHDRGQAVAIRGTEPAGREPRVVDEVSVEESDGAAAGPLSGEVIDVGDLDVIDQHQVLGRAAAADDEIVALVGGHVDGRERLEQAADVAG